MLVKLAFVMQRLKKYLKNFCHDQQRWGGGQFFDFMGGHSCYEGDIELLGVPQSPHQGNPDFTLAGALVTIQTINLSVPGSELKKEMNGRGRHLEQQIWFLTINQVQSTLFL